MTIPGAGSWSRLPGQDLYWEIDDRGLYLVPEGPGGRRHPVRAMGICANGTRDLCIARTPGGELAIVKTEETPPEMVLAVPDGDIAVFEFRGEVPGFSGKYLIVALDPSFDPLMRLALRRFPSLKMDLYDAYLGKDYGVHQ